MIRAKGLTHTGCVRDNNEDAIYISRADGLLLVADGMGGYACGEVASKIIVDTFKEKRLSKPLTESTLVSHHRILSEAEKRQNAKGMGATIVVAHCTANSLEICWVGDSRAYLYSKDKSLTQITKDHSYLEFLLGEGKITELEARDHPDRNIVTQSLGHNTPEPEVSEIEWHQGDQVILCSDGLTDELDDLQIETIIKNCQNFDNLPQDLIDAALQHGGKDNVSVIVAENISEDNSASRININELIPTVVGIAIAFIIAIVWFLNA